MCICNVASDNSIPPQPVPVQTILRICDDSIMNATEMSHRWETKKTMET
jgi:hypothetical protein